MITKQEFDIATKSARANLALVLPKMISYNAENGRYPPTQNGDIRSLFMLFALMAMQN